MWIHPDGPVVVGVDASTTSDRALEWSIDAARAWRRPLEVVHAWTKPLTGDLPDLLTMQPVPYEEFAANVLARAADRARALGPDLEVRPHLASGQTAAALLSAVADPAAVVVGSHGRDWVGSMLIGSVSQQCATHASCPVVVVPASWDPQHVGRVVAGVDGSDDAAHALRFAAAEALRRDARLELVHVVDHHAGWLRRERSETGHEWTSEIDDPVLSSAVSALGATVVGQVDLAAITYVGHPARTLVRHAEDAELLVVGPRGKGGFGGLRMGSVSAAALHHAGCPTVIVR